MGWILIVIGAVFWAIAADIDRVFNSGDVLGLVLIIAGVLVLTGRRK
jgi:hypothetical protein